jgi:hypothetical protein
VRELVVHQRRPEGTVTVRAAFQVFTLPQTYFSLLSMSMERNKGKAEPLFAFYVRWRSCKILQEGEGGNACAALWKKMTPCMHARRRYIERRAKCNTVMQCDRGKHPEITEHAMR